MVVLKIIRLGNPKLRLKSRKVRRRELQGKRFQQFLDNLIATCLKHNGVGIAAPQVGINKRVIVVNIDPKNPRYRGKKPFPLTLVINPKIITKAKHKKEDWEGDLSVDLRGLISRYETCRVIGLDRYGKEVIFDLENDFHARVFQHEIDHLDGIMFIDRVKNTKSLSEYKEWKQYWKPA